MAEIFSNTDNSATSRVSHIETWDSKWLWGVKGSTFWLWCLVASWVVDMYLNFINSFQKSNICWPQQPPTEKVLNFNLIFHDSTKTIFFSKHQSKINLRREMTLKPSILIFKTLEPLLPPTNRIPHFSMRHPVLG